MTDVSIRRADFMMVLAYASDLATGHSRDFALKSCVLAMRIAELAGVSDEVRRNAYHQSMLRYVGCNADTDLLSATFGDEIALRQDLVGLDMGNRAELGRVFVQAFKRFYYDLEPDAQARAIEAAMSQALAVARPVLTAHCEVAQRIGERLGLSEDIRRAIREEVRRDPGDTGGPVKPEAEYRIASGRRYRNVTVTLRNRANGRFRRLSPERCAERNRLECDRKADPLGYIGSPPSSARAGTGAVGIEEAVMRTAIPTFVGFAKTPWNKGRLIGQKRPLKPKDV